MSTEGLFNRSRVGWIHWLVVVAGHPGAEDVSVEGKEHLVQAGADTRLMAHSYKVHTDQGNSSL